MDELNAGGALTLMASPALNSSMHVCPSAYQGFNLHYLCSEVCTTTSITSALLGLGLSGLLRSNNLVMLYKVKNGCYRRLTCMHRCRSSP